LEKFRPKHTIFDIEKFAKERAKLGGLAQEGMRTTGGTDIDWIIEHRGGFIVMENKTFSKDWIKLPVGQVITFEQMLTSQAVNILFEFHITEIQWQ